MILVILDRSGGPQIVEYDTIKIEATADCANDVQYMVKTYKAFEWDRGEEKNMILELFKFDTCPYCRRVLEYIESTDRKDIVFHDIRKNPEAAERLAREGGKLQAPCLFIDGMPLYESLDIIQWLEEHPEE